MIVTNNMIIKMVKIMHYIINNLDRLILIRMIKIQITIIIKLKIESILTKIKKEMIVTIKIKIDSIIIMIKIDKIIMIKVDCWVNSSKNIKMKIQKNFWKNIGKKELINGKKKMNK